LIPHHSRSSHNGEQTLVPRNWSQVETSGQTGATTGACAVRTEVPVVRGHLVSVLPLDHLRRLGRFCHMFSV